MAIGAPPFTPAYTRARTRYMRAPALTAIAVVAAAVAANGIAPITLVPQQVSAHGWIFQGEAGMASAKP